jgi:hypothetical protein
MLARFRRRCSPPRSSETKNGSAHDGDLAAQAFNARPARRGHQS